MKAEGGGDAEAAGALSLVLRADGLGRVLDDGDAAAARHVFDGVVVADVAVEIDGDDRARARRDGFLERARVHAPCRFVDVDEDRRGADVRDRRSGGDPRGIGNDHFVARSDAEGQQREVKPRRA